MSSLRSAFFAHALAFAALSGVDAATSMPGPTSTGNRWVVIDNKHPKYDNGAGYTDAGAACITPAATTTSNGVTFPGSGATDEQAIDFCLDYCRAQANDCNFMWVYEGPVGAGTGYRCCPKGACDVVEPTSAPRRACGAFDSTINPLAHHHCVIAFVLQPRRDIPHLSRTPIPTRAPWQRAGGLRSCTPPLHLLLLLLHHRRSTSHTPSTRCAAPPPNPSASVGLGACPSVWFGCWRTRQGDD